MHPEYTKYAEKVENIRNTPLKDVFLLFCEILMDYDALRDDEIEFLAVHPYTDFLTDEEKATQKERVATINALYKHIVTIKHYVESLK